MGFLDAPMRAVAKTMVGKFGTSVTFRLVSRAGYDVHAGSAAETLADTAIKGVLVEFNSYELGDDVKLGDRKLMVAAKDLSVAPGTGDRILI